jgi:3D (Asp-Asp-Asp) domain-containing protein
MIFKPPFYALLRRGAMTLLIVLASIAAPVLSNADNSDAQDSVTLILDNESVVVSPCPPNVAELFTLEGIAEPPESFNLDAGAPLMPGDTIRLEGVTVAEAASEIELPAPVMFRYEFAPYDQRIEILDEGTAGLERVTVRCYYRGSVKLGERRITETLVEPVRKLVLMHVGVSDYYSPTFEELLMNPLLSRELSPPVRYSRKLMCEATAYYPGFESNGSWGNTTAMGYECMPGRIAVDPNFIPLGSRLFVENYGYCVAVDTGGAIKGNIIDVCFWTREECMDWGRRDVWVYVLE